MKQYTLYLNHVSDVCDRDLYVLLILSGAEGQRGKDGWDSCGHPGSR